MNLLISMVTLTEVHQLNALDPKHTCIVELLDKKFWESF